VGEAGRGGDDREHGGSMAGGGQIGRGALSRPPAAACGSARAPLTAPFPERPRGMHRKTYARLRHRAEQLEARISRRVGARATDYLAWSIICRL